MQEKIATGHGREAISHTLEQFWVAVLLSAKATTLQIAHVAHLAALVVHLAALVVHLENLYPPSCLSLGQYSMALLYILTAGSKSDLSHSLHRCRILQRRSQQRSASFGLTYKIFTLRASMQ